MTLRVAVNGFGRIDRMVVKAACSNRNVEIVAINDLTDTGTLAHLFKYDSVHGIFPGQVEHSDDSLVINGRPIRIHAQRNPTDLPWKEERIDVVLESTGLFTSREKAEAHIRAGAGQVIITAPATNDDITIVMGVNHHLYDPARHQVISNASCTTNCLAPGTKPSASRRG